jgi:hypothetical protein
LDFLFLIHKKKKAAKKTYSIISKTLIIREAFLLKGTVRKFERSETSAYKKITLSSTILLVLLKKTKNKTKGETWAKKPIKNNNTNLC